LERLEEATSHSNEELKEGIRDIAGKKSRLEVKLKEEETLREVSEDWHSYQTCIKTHQKANFNM
jgi:hypothetical protein